MRWHLWETKIVRCSEEYNVSKAPDKADNVGHSEMKTSINTADQDLIQEQYQEITVILN